MIAPTGVATSPLNPKDANRFWEKVQPQADGCWAWTAERKPDGYGRFKLAGTKFYVHRIAYEHGVGPIPDGLQIDHRCHGWDTSCYAGNDCTHRACVNPSHLRPLTGLENTLGSRGRGERAFVVRTHCMRGHELTDGNVLRDLKTGKRRCLTCSRNYHLEYGLARGVNAVRAALRAGAITIAELMAEEPLSENQRATIAAALIGGGNG